MENSENPKNQLVQKLKDANNILVTVSTNPTVDQLSAAIGLTLYLTKLKKHATTVFSGQIPSTIDFLKPEETIETNTDSLRDFIISLDKNKADKIRYKVEDAMVKIFITPYRTSIDEDDLIFSQGDFNVDVVVALGVQNRDDIDQAIMAHGRILHDAVVATVNLSMASDIGTINWTNPQASSLCEMIVTVTDLLKTNFLDGQIATSLLTGIIAETQRFSNEKTTSTTMTISAKLLAAGANQQLVSTRLRPSDDDDEQQPPEDSDPEPPQNPSGDGDTNGPPKDAVLDDDGSLRINHPENTSEDQVFDNSSFPVTPPVIPEPWTPDDSTKAGVSQLEPIGKSNPTNHQIENNNEPEEIRIGRDTRPSLNDELLSNFTHQETAGIYDPPYNPLQPTNYDEAYSRKDESTSDNTDLVTQPPRFGGQLSATSNGINENTNPLGNLTAPTPILHRKSEVSVQQHTSKKQPQNNIPPEPYTVYEPEPTQSTDKVPHQSSSAISPPSPVTNQPKAAKPIDLSLPPISQTLSSQSKPPTFTKSADAMPSPVHTQEVKGQKITGHTFVDMGDNTLDQIEEKTIEKKSDKAENKSNRQKQDIDYKREAIKHLVKAIDDKPLDQIEDKVESENADEPKNDDVLKPNKHVDYRQEAVNHIAKVMSGTPLNQLEEKVGKTNSPQQSDSSVDYKQVAAEYAAKAVSNKTLEQIEKKVDSQHINQQGEKDDNVKSSVKEEISALSYETHESEPPEKVNPLDLEDEEPKQTQKDITNDSKDRAEDQQPTNVDDQHQGSKDVATSSDKEDQIPTESNNAEALKADEARGEVTKAINTGGDGRTSLPPLQAISASGELSVKHEDSSSSYKPSSETPKHTGPSPIISIDPDDGTLIPLPPNSEASIDDKVPQESTTKESVDKKPPAVPPPLPVAVGGLQSQD